MPVEESLLEKLRTAYETARQETGQRANIEGFQAIDARLRKAFRWLEKAISYLDGLKPAIKHRFDVGHGIVFESLKFERGYVGQHTRRIAGFPVLDEINVYYEIAAAKPPMSDVATAEVALAEKALDEAGIPYTCRRVEDAHGIVRKCLISAHAAIPSAVSFRADYEAGSVSVTLFNVDRFDRVTLQFESRALDETVLEDLIRFILGENATFLRRAPLAGIHSRPA